MMKARSLLLSKSLRPRIKSIAASSTVTSPSDGESGSIAVAAVAAAALALSTSERKRERQWCHPSAASAFAAAGSLILSSSVRCESLGQEDIIGSSSGVRTIVPEPTDDKSISAHRTAAEHDLFRDELISAGMVENNSINERFVSVSPYAAPAPPIRHRVSVRHAHRLTEDDDDEEEKLLATSSEDIPAPAKNYNTTLGAVAEITEKDMAAAADSLAGLRPDRKDALLRRIKTCSSDHEDQVYTKKMYFYKHGTNMKPNVRAKFRLFALPSSESLGKEMAFLLDTELNCIDVGSYTDGETSVQIGDAVRGKNVYVVCATTSATSIAELLLTISALRRGSAKRINLILPYYGYSRQDRRTGMKREPIAAADMAKLFEEMGVDSVMCVDLHNALVKGFFSPSVPVDHLSPGPVAAAYFYEELFGVGEEEAEEKKEEEVDKKVQKEKTKKEGAEKKKGPKITVVAAHENQVFRANVFRNALMKLSGSDDIRVALVSNSRAFSERTMSDNAEIVGAVKGRQCIIVDDIITTGGTMIKAIKALNNAGAKEVYAWATHGVLHMPENDVRQQLEQMDGLKYLLISNTVAARKDEKEVCSKIRKLSIAPLLSEAVIRALHHESIRHILDMKLSESGK